MEKLFNIDLKTISVSSKSEALDRKKNYELFLKGGFPNKKDENWKFSDLKFIINNNFENITNNEESEFDKKIEFIDDFDHNHIILVNGLFKSCDIGFEDKEKVKIKKLNSGFDFQSNNSLLYLNKALSLGGFYLEVNKDYKCKKPIIIYNYFTSNLENKIINNSNKIKLNQNSELTLIEYNIEKKVNF